MLDFVGSSKNASKTKGDTEKPLFFHRPMTGKAKPNRKEIPRLSINEIKDHLEIHCKDGTFNIARNKS
jgi:hypothetical protein